MRKKQFRAESRKLLDLMVNSIYIHREIFLRELISNASDAIDKLHFRSLTDPSVTVSPGDYRIALAVDRDRRILTVRDNGCGMTADELENDLGTIARSGSLDFRTREPEAEKKEDIEIIGQFGVGFYSAFMVADRVTVESRAYGAAEAHRWESEGASGYTVGPCGFDGFGTLVTLHLKEDTENEKYSEFLEPWKIRALVTKYSDYIRYPIQMEMPETRSGEDSGDGTEPVFRLETLNSRIPLWRRNRSEVKPEEYNAFYKSKFCDFEDPAAVIHSRTEGAATFASLLFIPKRAPLNFYSGTYEKGLQLYSRGVLVMEKCADLLPDHFAFVRGLVDSEDLSLNISREILQHDHQVKLIARTIEKRIRNELARLMEKDRELYEELWKEYGAQLTYGVYSEFGAHREELQDLLLFRSSSGEKPVSLKEYVSRMKEGQKNIYFACGRTPEAIAALPQTEEVKDRGYEILYMTSPVDEFSVQVLREYDKKPLVNICSDRLDLDTEEEKTALREENEASGELFAVMKEALGDRVREVRFTNRLRQYPACLTTEGALSLGMEKTLNSMPGAREPFRADVVLEINRNHAMAGRLKELFAKDREELKKYALLLHAESCLIAGVAVPDPAGICRLVDGLMLR